MRRRHFSQKGLRRIVLPWFDPPQQLDIASFLDRDDLLGSIAGNKPDAGPHRRIPEFQER
jgi:hypothetical protein